MGEWIVKIAEAVKMPEWYRQYEEHPQSLKITTKITDTGYLKIGGNMQWPTTDGANGLVTTMELDKRMIQSGANVIPHEMGHIICGASFSYSLNEGAANYCSRKCIGSTVETGPVANVNDWLKGFYEVTAQEKMTAQKLAEFEPLKEEIMNCVGSAAQEYPYGNSGDDGILWYAYSESFFTYLADTYGMEAVMELYHKGTDNSSYTMLDAKGYEGILQDWKQFYEGYEANASYEQMMQYQKDLQAGMMAQQ